MTFTRRKSFRINSKSIYTPATMTKARSRSLSDLFKVSSAESVCGGSANSEPATIGQSLSSTPSRVSKCLRRCIRSTIQLSSVNLKIAHQHAKKFSTFAKKKMKNKNLGRAKTSKPILSRYESLASTSCTSVVFWEERFGTIRKQPIQPK